MTDILAMEIARAFTEIVSDNVSVEKHEQSGHVLKIGHGAINEAIARALLAERNATAARVEEETIERAAKVAFSGGVTDAINIFGGLADWYRHGQRIGNTLRKLPRLYGKENP